MKKYLVIAALMVLAFAAGFLPAQIKLNHLRGEYQQARLHRLLGVTLIDAQLGNFATARERATEFFDAVRDTSQATSDDTAKAQLNRVLMRRDEVISDLAANNPDGADKLRGLFIELPNPESGQQEIARKR